MREYENDNNKCATEAKVSERVSKWLTYVGPSLHFNDTNPSKQGHLSILLIYATNQFLNGAGPDRRAHMIGPEMGPKRCIFRERKEKQMGRKKKKKDG